jgi:hypothetical protein
MTTTLCRGASPVGPINATPDADVIDLLKRLPSPAYPEPLRTARRARLVEQIAAEQVGSDGPWLDPRTAAQVDRDE